MIKRGFTLVETIVVIAATTLLMLVLSSMLSYFYKTNEYTLEQSQAIEQARRGVADAMTSLRQASYADDGSYPVATAATSTLTFYTDVTGASIINQVTYTLINGTLYRATISPAGNPLSYAGQPTSTTTIASNIVNSTSTPVFTYFNNSGVQLSAPVNISQIAFVVTTVVVDVNVNRAPVSFTLSGGATLRNLRSQP